MLIIVLFFFLLSILLGYMLPRKTGWFMMFIYPLFYNINFKLISAGFADLTLDRILLGVTLGMVLNGLKGNSIANLGKDKFVIFFITFNLILSIIMIPEHSKEVFGGLLPFVFYSIFFSLLLVKSESDIERLVKLFVWQTSIVSVFIVIEYFTSFNIYEVLKKLDPEYSEDMLIISKSGTAFYRAGLYRASGIDGGPIKTGCRLALMFPLTMWYAKGSVNFLKYIPILLTVLGAVLLQSRAPVIAIIISLLLIPALLTYTNRIRVTVAFKQIFSVITVVGVALLVIYSVPQLSNIFKSFISFSTGDEGAIALGYKTARIPIAVKYFFENPILGYGDPQYVYFELMNTEDIPAVLGYFLSGGVFLGGVYIIYLFSMPVTLFKKQSKVYSRSDSVIYIYIIVAIIAGITQLFANWVEAHLILVYFLYMATFHNKKYR